MYGALTELSPGTVATTANPVRVVVSPDGKNVYCTTSGENRVCQYERNTETGKLTALAPASLEIPHELFGLLISGDGKYVYVASQGGEDIIVFSRNAETGKLTEVSKAAAPKILPRDIAESPDEKHIYAVGESEPEVIVFGRNKETGALEELSKAALEKGGRMVIVSPDGKHVYVLCEGATIRQFSRNSTTGALTALEPWIIETADSSSRDITITPDGANVYVCNEGPRNVNQYSRNATTGELTSLGTKSAVNEPEAILAAPDSETIYASNWNSGINQWSRGSGELTALTPATVAAETHPLGLACSPDGKDVYVACRGSNVIEQYSRSLTPTPPPISGSSEGKGSGTLELTRPGPEPIEPGESAGKGSGTLTLHTPKPLPMNESAGKSTATLSEFGIRAKWRLTPLTPEELATGSKPNDVIVSADGKNVYVCNEDSEKSISVYKRNTETGVLTAQETIKSTHSLEFIAISPDGKSVYAMYFNHVLTYERNTETGALTFKASVTLTAEEWEPTGIVVSPDGKDVYACDLKKINHLTRNEGTGELTLSGTTYALKSGENGVGGIVISPDGKHVYALSQPTKSSEEGEVKQYSRNAETGELTALSPASVSTGEGMPRAITITPDGKGVYVATEAPNRRINEYSRNTETGKLTTISSFEPPYTPCRILAADNETIYVTNEFEGGIESFGVVSQYHRDVTGGGLAPAVKFAAAKMRKAHAIAVTADGKSAYVTRNQAHDGVHPSYGEWGVVELSRAEVSTPEFLLESNGQSGDSLFLGIASVISGESSGVGKGELILSIPVKFLGMVV